MDKLLALVAELADDDEDNHLRLINAALSGEQLELRLQISTFDSTPKIWLIRCDNVLDYRLSHGFASASSLELASEHPLLWEYNQESALAFFYGAPDNASAAVGALYEAHQRIIGDWLCFGQYLNDHAGLHQLLKEGNGLLARGPLPILAVYKNALDEYGVEVNICSPYSPPTRKRLLEVWDQLRVLIIGDSYVTGLGWSAHLES